MTVVTFLAALASCGLFVYLFVALLKPEVFP